MQTNIGEKHIELEKRLRDYLEVENIELLTNGHMAIELSIKALNLQGEVITTPFTFASTTHAIVRNGLTPVFCDINEEDFTIDANSIEKLITDRTCAIIPVHVYGNICDVDGIDTLAKKYGLKVLYDAAHAFGEKYKGIGVGNFGDVSCFSFHATKVFNTIEGGAACVKNSNKEIKRRISRLKNFGIRDEECVDEIGANGKMNEFCAAMGICNLKYINENIIKRKKIVDKYREFLDGVTGIKLNVIQEDVESNYSYFPIVVDEKLFGASRNEIAEELEKKSIYLRKYFYPITNSFECFHGKYDVSSTPVALHISNRVLSLPLYPELTGEEVRRICEKIISCRY